MNQPPLEQLFAELIHCTGEAMGLLAAAIARQTDALALTEHLRAQIKAHEVLGGNALSRRIATSALAAIEAESALQAKDRH